MTGPGGKSQLTETFATLTAVLDGHGFISDSGVQGRRGYTGDEWLFSWVGATTPLPGQVWKVMAQLGSRLFFYSMPDTIDQPAEDLAARLQSGASYRDRVAAGRDQISRFLPSRFEGCGGVRAVAWDRTRDRKDLLDRLANLAKLVAKLRGVVSVWKEGDHGADFGYSPPNIEGPERALAVLYNLARGHALLHGRRQLTEDDLPLVTHVALSSAPTDRSRLFRKLIENHGALTTREAAAVLQVSRPTAARAMKALELLGLADVDEAPPEAGDLGTPAHYLDLRSDWKWCVDLASAAGGGESQKEVCESDEPDWIGEEPEEIR